MGLRPDIPAADLQWIMLRLAGTYHLSYAYVITPVLEAIPYVTIEAIAHELAHALSLASHPIGTSKWIGERLAAMDDAEANGNELRALRIQQHGLERLGFWINAEHLARKAAWRGDPIGKLSDPLTAREVSLVNQFEQIVRAA